MKKLLIFICYFFIMKLSFPISNKVDINDVSKPNLPSEMPLIPLVPAIPNNSNENVDENGNIRYLEKNFTVMMEAKVNVFIPLEIVSDISIDATVYGDEIIQVPFEIELNKEPEKKNFYKIHYSEDKLDIDKDGKFDTFIYSPEFANSKVISNNYVEVQGGNISKEGTHQRKVYVTVEAGL